MTGKRKSTRKVSPSDKKELISAEEVYNVLEFAKSAYDIFGGIYTPDLVNARAKDITMSPIAATASNINTALADPKNNETQLAGYSEYLELNSMIYKRILLYFSGLMSFDWNYVCINADEKDYKSPAYKKDLAIVKDFFTRFNVKESFKIALKEMLRNEIYFGSLRTEGDKYVLQELPQNRCKLVGRFDYGLIYDFDMYFFWQVGVSLDMFHPFFKKAFGKAFGDGGGRINEYNPAANIDARSGTWVYWTQTSPDDGFVAFKLFPEITTRVPFLSPFMPDAILQPIIRALQTDTYIASASKIIAGQVPFLKDAKASVKDQIALDPSTLGKFLQLFKSGLPSAIKVASAPLDNIAALQFDANNTMYDSYLTTSAASSGINSRLIYSKDRQNILETKLSMNIDENILSPVYSQFSNMLDFWVNKRTKKFKFKFMFEGFENSINRDDRFDKAMKLSSIGVVLPQKFASAIGVSPFDLEAMLAEGRANDWVEKLTPIIASAQMSGASGGGRPQKADGSLSEGGAGSRESGDNEEKLQE